MLREEVGIGVPFKSGELRVHTKGRDNRGVESTNEFEQKIIGKSNHG